MDFSRSRDGEDLDGEFAFCDVKHIAHWSTLNVIACRVCPCVMSRKGSCVAVKAEHRTAPRVDNNVKENLGYRQSEH